MPILRKRPQLRIALIFLLVLSFLGAQVLWWVIFLSGQLQRHADARLADWKRESSLFQSLLMRYPKDAELWRKRCEKDYPYLDCRGETILLRETALSEMRERGHRSLRMFVFESLFFALMVLGGLLLLMQSIRAERELKQRQNNFLSAVSHELRTPISTMRLALETMLYRELPMEKQKRYIQRLQGNLDRLHATLEQVLAAAMLEEHALTPRSEALDLNATIARYLEKHKGDHEEATIRFLPSSSPLLVMLEPLAIELILNNLLSNAIKHNPKPKKEISLAVATQGRYGVLRVEDDGVTIPPQERTKIFEAFYRIGSELDRKSEGLGLGLYLVKSLVHRMGGEITLEGREEGNCFTLYFLKA
jgi:signal transduction histidine kinase